MSSTNLDTVRAVYAALRAADADSALAAFAPDAEWVGPAGLAEFGLGGTHTGHRAIREQLTGLLGAFGGELRPEPEEFIEADDQLVVLGSYQLGTATGVTGSARFTHTWRLADGLVHRLVDSFDTAAARALFGPGGALSDPRADILRLGLGFCGAKVVLAAVELGVFTALAEQPLSLDQAVAELGLHGRGARDFFDSLVSLGLLEREAGRYRNTPVTGTFLDQGRPETYSGGLLELANDQWYDTWRHLSAALRTGRPQYAGAEEGRGPFEALYADPELLRKFQRGMTGASLGGIIALAERFPWPKYQTVIDVGCSEGTLLSRVLSRHESLSGAGFDLPDVAPTFAATVTRFDLADRMTFRPGSFFTDPLPSADVITFGHILHDWDLDTRKMLLRKAYEALPESGSVVVVESLIDDERRYNTFSLLMSLHLLVESPGGNEYTGTDCRDWLTEAGFRDCRVEHLAGPESMVVGVK